MRTKPLYLHRIADRAFFIYRLSNYANERIKLIHAGVAFNNSGNFTDKFESLRKKYNLNDYYHCTHVTTDTFKEFCDSLYLSAEQTVIIANPIPIPSVVYQLLKEQYYRNEKSDDEKTLRTIERYIIRNKDKVLRLLNK